MPKGLELPTKKIQRFWVIRKAAVSRLGETIATRKLRGKLSGVGHF